MKISLLMLLVVSLASFSSYARKLAGVSIEESLVVDNQPLTLNGAGIRSKFIFDIYVAVFYTAEPVHQLSELKVKDKAMRMAMHFIYDEVSKDKLVDAWNEGFENNLSATEFKKLNSRIRLFNSFFETAKSGDVINLDYIPGKGTSVSINNKNKGLIEGNEFYRALLLIWLGEDPVGESLKADLLGRTLSDDE